MARQLGQFLLASGAISGDQLEVALEAQMRFGGRLGFNLVDLGYLSPSDLARHLGAFHGVAAAEPTEVRGVRWDILNSIPRDLLLKHRAIPVAMSKGRITVVMSDPSNVPAIDEMAFATGKAVTARVAPDFIIKRALETYFGASFVELVRPQQAIAVAELVSQARAAAPGRPAAPARTGGLNGNHVARAPKAAYEPEAEPEFEIETIPGLETRPARRRLDEDEWLGDARAVRGEARDGLRDAVLEALAVDELPLVVGEVVEAEPVRRRAIVPIHDVASACRELADARQWSDVVAVVLGFASTVVDRAALFRVGPRGLRGWNGIGGSIDPGLLRATRLPVRAGFTADVLAKRGLVLRELRQDPTAVSVARALGGVVAPRSALGARIDVRGEPVAFFYGDDAGAAPGGGVVGTSLATRLQQGGHRSELEILLRKVEVALEMVSVRRWLPKV
ncbi:MAG: hypothetical protein IPK07_14615 [Deltaproteobacteria bacterium]|nr:hypothetical protein [Deltaproteobacteria bacterium]